MAATAGLILNTLLGGVTSFLASGARSRAARSQAQRLKDNMGTLQREIERGEVNMNEALQRIDTLISSTKGELKGIMEKQVDQTVRDIKEQYQTGLKTAMDNIRQELGQRRLFGSEAGVAARRKTAGELGKGAQKEIAGSRERALNLISKQMAELNIKGGLMKEGERKAFQQFRLRGLGEMMQLGSMAGSMEEQGKASPWLAGLSGAVKGGLGSLIGEAFTPGEELKETPVGGALPTIQEPGELLR